MMPARALAAFTTVGPSARRQAGGLRAAAWPLPWVLDAAVALAVLGLGVDNVFRPAPPGSAFSVTSLPAWAVVVTVACQSLPLAFRRRAPLGVLAVLLAVCVAQVSLSLVMRSDLGLLVALYGVCRYKSGRPVVWASAATFAALGYAVAWLPSFANQQLAAAFFLGCAIVAAIALGLVARTRHAQLEALGERAALLETEREQREALAAAAERARVSREMHDIVGHNLAVITGLADGAARLPPADHARAGAALQLIADTSRQALSELRRTLGALREPPFEGSERLSPQPGLGEVPALLGRVRAAGPQVSYTGSGALASLAPGLQLTVYRIVQEALTNVLKHAAGAPSVEIEVAAGPENVILTVTNSGPPARPPGMAGGREGQGLIGIRERALLAGGTAGAGPREGGGWQVRAVLPLTTQEPA